VETVELLPLERTLGRSKSPRVFTAGSWEDRIAPTTAAGGIPRDEEIGEYEEVTGELTTRRGRLNNCTNPRHEPRRWNGAPISSTRAD
jgi:hypothetical protein